MHDANYACLHRGLVCIPYFKGFECMKMTFKAIPPTVLFYNLVGWLTRA